MPPKKYDFGIGRLFSDILVKHSTTINELISKILRNLNKHPIVIAIAFWVGIVLCALLQGLEPFFQNKAISKIFNPSLISKPMIITTGFGGTIIIYSILARLFPWIQIGELSIADQQTFKFYDELEARGWISKEELKRVFSNYVAAQSRTELNESAKKDLANLEKLLTEDTSAEHLPQSVRNPKIVRASGVHRRK